MTQPESPGTRPEPSEATDAERLDWLGSHSPCPEGKMIASLSRDRIDSLMRAHLYVERCRTDAGCESPLLCKCKKSLAAGYDGFCGRCGGVA